MYSPGCSISVLRPMHTQSPHQIFSRSVSHTSGLA